MFVTYVSDAPHITVTKVAKPTHVKRRSGDSNRIEVFTTACQAMCDMDLRDWLPKITSPALVLGGDEDLMTPWDQGPDGAGQQAIADGIRNAETHVIRGSNHSSIFDNSEEHNRVVIDFFKRHSRMAAVAAAGEHAAG